MPQLARRTGESHFSGSRLEAVTHPDPDPGLYLRLAYSLVKAGSSGAILARELRESQSARQVGRDLIGPRYADPSGIDLEGQGGEVLPVVREPDAPIGPMSHRQLGADAVAWPKDAHATLGRVDALVGDPSLKETVDNAAVLSARLRKVADDGGFDRMVKGVGEAAERLNVLLGDNQYDVRGIVQDLRVTSANLRELSETIKRYPAGALFAGPPAKVPLAKGSP